MAEDKIDVSIHEHLPSMGWPVVNKSQPKCSELAENLLKWVLLS